MLYCFLSALGTFAVFVFIGIGSFTKRFAGVMACRVSRKLNEQISYRLALIARHGAYERSPSKLFFKRTCCNEQLAIPGAFYLDLALLKESVE